MSGARAGGAAPRCPFCRELVAAGTRICPHCDEALPAGPGAATGGATGGARLPLRPLVAAVLAGVACGLFLLALGDRLRGGSLAEGEAVLRSLRFLETAAAAGFLLLLAALVGARPR